MLVMISEATYIGLTTDCAGCTCEARAEFVHQQHAGPGMKVLVDTPHVELANQYDVLVTGFGAWNGISSLSQVKSSRAVCQVSM